MVRTRINPQGAGVPRNDKVDLFLSGYHAAMVANVGPDIDIGEDNISVYGYEDEINTRVLNAGTLTATLYDHPDKSSDIIAVLKNKNPAGTTLRGYMPDGSHTVDLIQNWKHPRKNHYIKTVFFPAWSAVLRPTTGAPRDAQVRNLDGRCGIPVEFEVPDPEEEMVYTTADVAAMTVNTAGTSSTGTLVSHNSGITQIPADTLHYGGKYALVAEAQKRDTMTGEILKSARLTVRAAMLNATGVVTINPADLSSTPFNALAEVTHMWMVFIKHVTSVVVGTNYLLGDGVDIRGRWDTTT